MDNIGDISLFFELDTNATRDTSDRMLGRLWIYKGIHDSEESDLYYFELLDQCLLLWEGYDQTGQIIAKALTESFEFCGIQVHRYDVTND